MTIMDNSTITTSTIDTRTESSATSSPCASIGGSDSSPTAGVPPIKPSVLNPLKHKSTLTLLLIGETGTGKTAFMSLLANLFLGRGVLELEDLHDPSKESGLSKSQSQTTTATLYTITSFDDLEIRILDTPGLADTRGIDQDNMHKAEINRAIREHVTSIDAVLIMANGSVQRLGAATEYTLSILTSMFPYSIVENIGFIFTNSDPLTWNFRMESLPIELRQSQHWVIQNPLALLNNYKIQTNEGAGTNTKKLLRKLNASYEETVETLNEWLEWLDERPVKPTNEINELYEKSIDIESSIEASLSSITRLAEQRVEWEKIVADLENMKNRKDGIEASVKQQTALIWTRLPSDTYNTICIAADCYSNCRPGSTPTGPFSFVWAAYISWRLRMSTNTTCRICNHKTDQHRCYKQIHAQKQGEVDEETKQEWENALTEEQQLEAAQNAARKELVRIEIDAVRIQNEIHRLIDEYNKISLSRNFAGHIRSAIQMLEYRRDELYSKAGTDTELALVNESIAKLKEKLNIIEKQTKGIHQVVAGKVKGIAKSIVVKVPSSIRQIGPNWLSYSV